MVVLRLVGFVTMVGVPTIVLPAASVTVIADGSPAADPEVVSQEVVSDVGCNAVRLVMVAPADIVPVEVLRTEVAPEVLELDWELVSEVTVVAADGDVYCKDSGSSMIVDPMDRSE